MRLLRIAIGMSTLVAVAVATPGVAGAAPSAAATAGSVAVGSDLVPVFDPATRQARTATSTTAAAVIGYPSNVAGGEQQASCQGQLSRRSITNSDQQLNCNLGKGSSGGPWLRDYANGLGIAVSNTSYGINPDPQGPVFGPYYDGDTLTLYNAAENASP
ncbi:hypothetical protein ABT297_31685 [Dactylosporangium sp. NPDC000555]|uniref:hypothetical protein n=1 Tax=Dactylosporangium sp. NPDC000555 TaxID=3154260 RepID=UPI0033311B72